MALLKKQGHEVKVLYGVGEAKNADDYNAVKISRQSDYYFHNALSKITDHTGLYSRRSTLRLIEEIRAFRPDLIHLHTLHGYYVNYEILFEFLKRADIPLVWTLHDCWPFTGHCTHFSQMGCTQWQTLCSKCPQLRRYPKCYFRGDVQKNYARKKEAFSGMRNLVITAPSHWLAKQISDSFLGRYPIRVVPNGVDLSIFYPQSSQIRQQFHLQEKKIVLSVANVWSQSKGMTDLFALNQMLDDSYQIVMIGLAESQLKQLPKGILGIQRTRSQTELAQWYSCADVFINPTYEETFGLTTVEAQACGTPVVVYGTDGCPETVANGNGIIIPQGNLEKLKSAIIETISGGKRAEPQAIRYFDKEYVYKDYLHLYEHLLQGSLYENKS